MATKKVDPLKAKEAKQKKIAIGGAVILLGVLGIQGPKTLKMLQGPQPVAAPTSTAPAATTPAPGASLDAAASGVPAAVAAELSAVPDSDLSPAAEQGQLATFERFSSKDPFAQQAEAVAAPTPPAPKAAAEKPSPDVAKSASPVDAPPSAGDEATDQGFTTGGSTPVAEPRATATSISVNGVAEDVPLGDSFPKDEPTFVLAKVAKDGKSVEIGIAGGEYAGGDQTITLAPGKTITLQNTSDGTRYVLELLAIQGFPVPKQKK